MELEQLRIFAAAAREGSLSGAARRLYISHSTVSRTVSTLERELGAKLMERGSHELRLTAAGETLLIESERLLHAAEEAARRVRAAGETGAEK